jgi:hypothetical protein
MTRDIRSNGCANCGRRVTNGIYFAKLQAEDDAKVRKLVLTR